MEAAIRAKARESDFIMILKLDVAVSIVVDLIVRSSEDRLDL